MANKLYDETSIQNIADAIRAKNGSSDTYKVSEMAQAILDIPSGGSGIEIQFFNYLTLDGECQVAGRLVSNYSYELKVNNLYAAVGQQHMILHSNLSDWDKWVSVKIVGLRYYFGNNDGSSVGGAGVGWDALKGDHTYLYDGRGNIKIDDGATATVENYVCKTDNSITSFILGGATGGGSYFYGQIEEFTIKDVGNQSLVYHYVPAGIVIDGVLKSSGMFDTVNNKYYTSDNGIATDTKLTS